MRDSERDRLKLPVIRQTPSARTDPAAREELAEAVSAEAALLPESRVVSDSDATAFALPVPESYKELAAEP